MRLRKLLVLLAVISTATAGVAVAATAKTYHTTKSFTLAAGQTKTFSVAFPHALKFKNAKYSGSVKILAPAGVTGSKAPSVTKVKVLSKKKTNGGTDYTVKVQNTNASGTDAVMVQITATTKKPGTTPPPGY